MKWQLVLVTALAACNPDSPGNHPPSDDGAGDADTGSDAASDSDSDGSDVTPSDTDGGDDGPVDTGFDPEPLESGPFKVLFDNSHGEDAGNADWVIDDDWPNPSPSSPSDAEDWTGAISSWGYDLWRTGRYAVTTLPPGTTITYGDATKARDLSKFDLFIVPEPNNHFTRAERNAILDFVADGGGLFMVADHGGSDRDNDGVDACKAWNALMDDNDRGVDPFGLRFRGNSFTEHPVTNLANLPDNRVLHGPFGEVTGMSLYSASSLTLTSATHPDVRGLIWRNGWAHGDDYVDFATSKYGLGRVAAVGDSSPADDGSANPGNANIYDGWLEAGVTNSILLLNASAWLVRDAGE